MSDTQLNVISALPEATADANANTRVLCEDARGGASELAARNGLATDGRRVVAGESPVPGSGVDGFPARQVVEPEDGLHESNAPFVAGFSNTEELCRDQSRTVDAGIAPPEGPGRDGNKPLMQNREVRDETLPDRNTVRDNLLSPGQSGHGAIIGGSGSASGNCDPSAHATDVEWKEAREREAVCVEYERLLGLGLSLGQAARALRKSPSWFSGDAAAYVRWKRLGLAGLLPERRRTGAPACELTRMIEELGWFVPAAAYFYMRTNRTENTGSVPEAVRRTISLPVLPVGWTDAQRVRFLRVVKATAVPVCPDDVREIILARQALGQDLVPETIARRIRKSKVLVEFVRNPTNAMLRTVNARGGSKFARRDGEYAPLTCGRRMTPDDGSINFVVWVPWAFPTDACSRKFGCMVGRFQLLLFVDVLSMRICARSFVVRPRSSYRQEDALHLYNVFMKQWGVPNEIWHEGHVWNAGRVKDCLDLLKVRRHLTHSPHNKQAVEGRFNKLWTVMSGLTDGQIGRFRGEMERENEVLASCQAGHTDPRKAFPSLAVALQVIDQAINEANKTSVLTDVGRWMPDDLWAETMEKEPLRKLEDGTEWMFAPFCLERVINNGITTKVPLFEDFSVPFTFASEWMPEFHGARARVYFDPYLERCRGKIVLAQEWHGRTAGTVLGDATQTNDIGEYARLMLGLGTGPSDAGRVMRQRQAAALRSDRRAITGDGRGLAVVEERDGAGVAVKWERDQKKRDAVESGPAKKSVDLMAEPRAEARPAHDDARYDDLEV